MAGAISQRPETWVRSVVTTAGDVEREGKSRLFNAVEGLSIYLLVLITLWPVCFLLGKIPGNEFILSASNIPLVLGALFLLFVSPFLHGDTAESWGLGNPFRLWRLLHEAPMLKRAIILTAIAVLMVVLNTANYIMWPEVAKFIGLKRTVAVEFTTNTAQYPFGPVVVVLFGLFLSTLIVTCGIRYDNFGSAFATAMKISLPLLAMTFIAAYAARGADAFSDFNPTKYALGVFGYVFWGAIQQLLFSSYFGTRMRKAFGPSTSATNVVPKSQRFLMALKIGGAIAAVLVPTGYIICRSLYGPEAAPPVLMLWFLGFTLPFGTAWGYFYSLDRKRMLVATLCGSFFGLIHIDSYGLVAVTFMLGVLLVYVFMEDKNRNLVALGFIHGLLGSTFGWLFDNKEQGALQVDYNVGPWNVEDPTMSIVIFPMICIAAYVLLLSWCIKNIKEDDAPAH